MIARIIFLILILSLAGMLLHADAVTYTYDDAGRLTSVTYPNGASIAYTYDAAGNLTARTVTAASSSARKSEPKAKPAAAEKSEKPNSGKATDSQSSQAPKQPPAN